MSKGTSKKVGNEINKLQIKLLLLQKKHQPQVFQWIQLDVRSQGMRTRQLLVDDKCWICFRKVSSFSPLAWETLQGTLTIPSL